MWLTLTMIVALIAQTRSQSTNDTSIARNNSELFSNENEPQIKDVCSKKKCVRKCCPPGKAFYWNATGSYSCEEYPDPLNLRTGYESFKDINSFDTKEYHFVYGIQLSCTGNAEPIVAYPTQDKYFIMESTGEFFIDFESEDPRYVSMVTLSYDKYCMDNFLMPDEPEPVVNAIFCHYQEDLSHVTLYGICMLVSCFFILLTVIVYAWVPELRNRHGKVLIACLLSFLVAFSILGMMNLLNEISRGTCIYLTFIIYYAMLAAFFWLNVMSYDIWCTFRRHFSVNSTDDEVRSKIYCAYAFGMPALLTALLAGIEYGVKGVHSKWLPNLYLGQCFITGNSKRLYLYGPMVLICIVNLIFFIMTATKITQSDSMLRSQDSARHGSYSKKKQRFIVYIKLFIMMGLTWVLEFISSVFPQYDTVWIVFDMYNISLGLVIFVMFVCKRRIYKLLFGRSNVSETQTNSTSVSMHTLAKDEAKLNAAKRNGDSEKA